MKKSLVRAVATLALLAAVLPVRAQQPPSGLPDPYHLLEPKDFLAHRSGSNNPDWNSNDDSKRPIPGETTVLADLEGPGVLTHMWVTIADNEYGWPRLLRLRIYYDGSATPSVDAPVGDFFAVGHGFERSVKSLMVRDSSAGRARNSYWPMPFRKSCRVTITNEGRRRVANLYFHVDWEKVPSLPANTPYFHARYRQSLPAPADGSNYQFLNVKGKGHYVGTVLSVVQAEAGWFGEGDDLFYVDGEKYPSIEGTGSEDYFNDAWGLHVDDGPYYGVTVADGTGLGSRMTAYRWHLVDPIPFTKSLKFEIEHKGWTFNTDGSVKSGFGERVDLMSSVAFWYQEGIAEDQPPVPYGSARLPQGNATQIEVESDMAGVKAVKGKMSMVPDLFWSKDVILFEAEGQGLEARDPLRRAGRRRLRALHASSRRRPTTASTRCCSTASRRWPRSSSTSPGADVRPQMEFDGYAYETYVGAGVPGGLAAADEGPPHADLRVPRQERRLHRLQPRRRQHRPREDGRRRLGGRRQPEGAAHADGVGRRARQGAVGPEPGDARPRGHGARQARRGRAAGAAGADGGVEGQRSERAPHVGQRHRRDRQGRRARRSRARSPRAPSRASRSTCCARAPARSARSASPRRRRDCRS